MKQVIIAPEAETDLDGISDYISLDNDDRAESFVREIYSKFLVIAERPCSFPVKDDLHPAMRSALHGKVPHFLHRVRYPHSDRPRASRRTRSSQSHLK